MTEVTAELINLFPVPLFKNTLKNNNNEQIKKFLSEASYNIVNNDGSQFLFIGEDTNVLDNEVFAEIKSGIEETFKCYSQEILKIRVDENLQFYFVSSWLLKLLPNGYGRPHNHNMSLYSGVVYLDVDEDTADITFYNKQNNFHPELIPMPVTEYNLINSETWTFKPKKNEVFLFPSSLIHSVGINRSKKPRYSLSFDIFVKGSLPKGYHGNLVLK